MMTSTDNEAIETVNPQTLTNYIMNYVLKGKAIGLLFMVLLSAFATVVLYMHRVDQWSFLAGLAMTLSGWLVTTDLVAHLWWDGYDSGITFSQFLKKLGRAHDIIGMIIYAIAMAGAFLLEIIQPITLAVTEIGVVIVFALLLKTKFYH
ncbi:MAG: hypothetical protein QXL94_00370 [Candidatus Parvarchaeum sp.]